MSLGRNFVTVGAGTALSRLLGFARDILVAAMLGSGPIADAFVVAFRLPNLFRRLLSEGAFNASFVPMLARIRAEEGEAEAALFSGRLLSVFTLGLIGLTLAAELAMSGLVTLLAPGFVGEAEKFQLTVWLARLAFPFLAFATIAALIAGLLNSRRRFVAAAYAPAVLNLVLVGALLAAQWQGLAGNRIAAVWLCWAVAFGGLAQLLERLWNPNCDVQGGDAVIVSVKFTVGDDGRLNGPVRAGGQESSGNAVIAAAARRAIDAVHVAAPFGPAYRNNSFTVNFNANKACSQR